MKKLAYILALFVGLNATTIVRKPDEEENQAIVVKDLTQKSTAAWIWHIAYKLKVCYYGITKAGILHELGFETIHKNKETHSINNEDEYYPIEANKLLTNNSKSKLVWIHFIHELKNGNESCELDFFVKKDCGWESFTQIL
jgi:hypothetical protein